MSHRNALQNPSPNRLYDISSWPWWY